MDYPPPEDAAHAAHAIQQPFKRGNKSTMRSKTITEDPAQNDASEVIRPNKVARPTPLTVTTNRDPASTSGAVQETRAHVSDRRIAQFDNKAFAQNEQETDRKYDAQSQYEAAKKMWSDGGDVAADHAERALEPREAVDAVRPPRELILEHDARVDRGGERRELGGAAARPERAQARRELLLPLLEPVEHRARAAVWP